VDVLFVCGGTFQHVSLSYVNTQPFTYTTDYWLHTPLLIVFTSVNKYILLFFISTLSPFCYELRAGSWHRKGISKKMIYFLLSLGMKEPKGVGEIRKWTGDHVLHVCVEPLISWALVDMMRCDGESWLGWTDGLLGPRYGGTLWVHYGERTADTFHQSDLYFSLSCHMPRTHTHTLFLQSFLGPNSWFPFKILFSLTPKPNLST
jgi:hypothetical protein